jgi:hypothetical protein
MVNGFPHTLSAGLYGSKCVPFYPLFCSNSRSKRSGRGRRAALFSLLLPWNMAGLMAILWRFFTEYLAIIMGTAVAVRMLGWGLSENIFKKGNENY